MSLAPALSSLPISSACFCRGQGQTPNLSIDGESIATRTMSPLAWRGNQPNRMSVSAFVQRPVRPGEQDDGQNAGH